jgi:hypothetical protein
MLDVIKNKWASLMILAILVAGSWLRLTVYKDLRLSIGMPDTRSYINSAQAPLFSWDSFSGRRLFTANLLFKLMDHDLGCEMSAESFPALNEEGTREVQPCFNTIVLLQNFVAVIAWCLLAWTVSRWLKHPLYRITAAVLIIAFGFTPQVAEWDSVLSSESLSVSMFVIMLACLQELIFRVMHAREGQSQRGIMLLAWLWLVIFLLWVFLRDVHIYAIPMLLLAGSPLYLMKHFRQSKTALAFGIILISIFFLGSISARQSIRWQPGLDHVLNFYIFPHPARMEYFSTRGMPDPASTGEYETWIDAEGRKTYALFLVSHPGFIFRTLLDLAHYFETDFIQPYYETRGFDARQDLLSIGRAVHPETNAVYILDTLLLISLLMAVWRHQDPLLVSWAGLAAWMFLYAGVSLFISALGDVDGTRRHVYPSVETFRLFFWIFSLVHLDLFAGMKKGVVSSQGIEDLRTEEK